MADAKTPRARRYAIVGVGSAAVLTLAILFFPWQWLRGPLERYLSHELQREVSIGALEVDPGRITRVRLNDLVIANAAWSKESRMASVPSADFYFSLTSLFKREADYVRLVEPVVLLERNADGDANWKFPGRAVTWPTLAAIDVERGNLRYLDADLKSDVALKLQTQATPGERSALVVSGRGKMRGETLTLDGKSAGLVALTRTTEP